MQHDSDEDINIDIDDSVVGVGREGGVRSMHRNGDGESSIDTLLRHWQDERMAPEILQYPAELIDEISDHIDAQQSAIAIITGANGGGGGDANNAPPARRPRRVDSEQHQQILLTELDIERVKWLLGSYLRTRTFKIEKFASYIIKYAGRGVDQLGLDDDDADDAARRNTRLALRKKLSDVELGYAERYYGFVIKHLRQSVTQNLPERMHRLDEDDMIVKPDLDAAVFARARRDCPPITLPDGQSIQMQKGDTHMLRYRSVRRLLRDGDVRLV